MCAAFPRTDVSEPVGEVSAQDVERMANGIWSAVNEVMRAVEKRGLDKNVVRDKVLAAVACRTQSTADRKGFLTECALTAAEVVHTDQL